MAPFTLALIVLIVLAIANLGAAIVLNVSMGKEHLPLFPTKLGKS